MYRQPFAMHTSSSHVTVIDDRKVVTKERALFGPACPKKVKALPYTRGPA